MKKQLPNRTMLRQTYQPTENYCQIKTNVKNNELDQLLKQYDNLHQQIEIVKNKLREYGIHK